MDVRVVGIAGLHLDYPNLIAQELSAQGLRSESFTLPFFAMGELRQSVIERLDAEIRKTAASAVSILCPGTAEYYLNKADINVHFSGYRSWFLPERMRVIAHPWSSAEPSESVSLLWRQKPSFTIGFMGTAYGNSRPARLVSSLPPAWKEVFLRGHHLRSAAVLARAYAMGVPLAYAMTFPRFEAVKALEEQGGKVGATVEVEDTKGFTGSTKQIERYEKHMRQVTYVLCPRGSENFSIRLYEALKFGRVPVLIDTDMVLPDGIAWDRLIVRVPYSRLSELGEIVLQDYKRLTATQFIQRQRLAMDTAQQLQKGSWAAGLADDVRRRLASR